MSIKIRPAKFKEHKQIIMVSKQSKYTRDFTNHMFSGEAMYEKGWIRVAVDKGKIVGFTCVRHKVRAPETSLYFIGVDSEQQGKDIGTALLEDLMKQCPNTRIILNVMKDNVQALNFYKRHKFVKAGESLKGKGVALFKNWR